MTGPPYTIVKIDTYRFELWGTPQPFGNDPDVRYADFCGQLFLREQEANRIMHAINAVATTDGEPLK